MSTQAESEDQVTRFLLLIAGVFFLFAPGTYAAEGEWSRFRGPNGSGTSDATTVPAKWTEMDYNWKVALPGVGHSSPVVWDHRVFLTCGDPETAQRTVVCLGAADGCTLWRAIIRRRPTRSTPTAAMRRQRRPWMPTA